MSETDKEITEIEKDLAKQQGITEETQDTEKKSEMDTTPVNDKETDPKMYMTEEELAFDKEIDFHKEKEE